MEISLFDRFGGSAAIYAVVELFYVRVLDDSKLAPFFADANMSELKKSQRDFMTAAFGGSNKSDVHLTEVHSYMVKMKGVGDAHFDAVAVHLQATLEELDVPARLVGEVMEIACGQRDAILRRVERQKAA